jgi:hypothetical protein
MSAVLDRVLHEERGGVLVIVIGFIPVAIVIAAFVIDVGNAFEHKRHLQLQADAAALAGASGFQGCRNNEDEANKLIVDRAMEYAGETSDSGPARNVLVQDQIAQDRVRYVINGTDNNSADFALGQPCEAGFIDVRMIEEESPAFFGFVGSHDYSGHARVQALRLDSVNGLLPLAVPVPDFDNAAAIFVREDTGATLQTAELVRAENEDEGGLAMWKTASSATVPISAEHVGVRIALSEGSSTTCGDAGVFCYDAGASTKGLVHIQGFSSSAGDGDQNPVNGEPRIKSVALTPVAPACEDSSFMPSFSPATPGCVVSKRQVALSAVVDFGGNPTAEGGTVTPVVNGVASTTPLAFDAASPWTARGVISIPSGPGPIDIDLNWEQTKGKIPPTGGKNDECKTGGGNKCKGTFADAQRHFRTDPARSGPIELMQVSEEGGAVHANSFERCSPGCEHELNVKIGIAGTLTVADPGDDAVPLRLLGGNQTRALTCSDPDIPPDWDGDGETDDTDVNLKGELEFGCDPWYTVNTGTPCPSPASAVTTLPKPWECVGLVTGNKMNQIASGLNARILGDAQAKTCSAPNNWPNFTDDDPRVVMVFLTGFGEFEDEGSTTVPVTGFAAFYVTGWNAEGRGFSNPCQGNGDDPAAAAGEIVGHYISRIRVPNDGGAGTNPCAPFTDITPCTAVLVE